MDSSCTDVWKLLHGVMRLLLREQWPADEVIFRGGEKAVAFLRVWRCYYGYSGCIEVSAHALRLQRFSALREHYQIFHRLNLYSAAPVLLSAGEITAMKPIQRQEFQVSLKHNYRVQIMRPLSASHVVAVLEPMRCSVLPVPQQLLQARSSARLSPFWSRLTLYFH